MTTPRKAPKVALVHDWLTNMGGAEPLVLEIHKLFPKAPIYTSVYDAEKMQAFKNIDVRTTKLQESLPKKLRYKHVLWPVFRAQAFRELDLSEFDVIISSPSAEAKAVRKTRPGQVHIAYIPPPPRLTGWFLLPCWPGIPMPWPGCGVTAPTWIIPSCRPLTMT